jgi:DNA-binding NtrC family response regulator
VATILIIDDQPHMKDLFSGELIEEEDMNKILIVDEEAAIRMLYQEELTEEGYDITTTDDYDALLEIIAEKDPDLVVMDVKRNGSSGLDILQEIRTAFNEIPIILCTAHDALKYDTKIASANHFMIKSSDLSRLKRTVRLAIEAREKAHGERLELAIRREHAPADIISASQL